MKQSMKRSFRVLIVEDETDLWSKSMISQLTRLAKERKADNILIDEADTALKARELLASHHYHLVSLDRHIADEQGKEITVDIGTELKKYIINHYPLTRVCEFTEHDSRNNADIWLKDNAQSWAEKVLKVLSKYNIWYFERATQLLPLPLASVSQNLHDFRFATGDWSGEQTPNVIDSVCKFWQYTFCLISRVGMATEENKSNYFDINNEQLLLQLEQFLLNHDTYQSYSQIWNDFLKASQVLNKFNEDFHQSDRLGGDWDRKLKAIYPAFEMIMDAAACWAVFPFVSGLRETETLDSNQLQVKANVLCGTELRLPTKVFSLIANPAIYSSITAAAFTGRTLEKGYSLLSMHNFMWVDPPNKNNGNRHGLLVYVPIDAKRGWKKNVEKGTKKDLFNLDN